MSYWLLSYLDLPLEGNQKTIGFSDLVVERIRGGLMGGERLFCHWGKDFLNLVLFVSHSYLSLFKTLVSLATKIETLQRYSLGRDEEGKKEHLIS